MNLKPSIISATLLIFTLSATTSCTGKKDKDSREKGSAFVDTESPEKLWLFVGTYTRKEGHVDGQADGLLWYELDTTMREIKLIDTYTDIVNPSYITIHPEGRYIYAVSETAGDENMPHGEVFTLKINTSAKKLELVNKVSSEGDYPCYITTDKDGESVMVANYGAGNIAFYPINEDGALDSATSIMKHTGQGPHERQASPHAHMVLPGPENDYILAVDLGTDEIYSYPVDYQMQMLTKQQVAGATLPGAGPRHITFHPLRKYAYVVNELNGTVEVFHYHDALGTLERLQSISTVEEGQNGNEAACADIHMSPDGRYLYASNRGDFNNIVTFKVDQRTGRLEQMGHISTNGKTPRNFVVSDDGTFVLAANQDSNNIAYFLRNNETGELTDTGVSLAVPTPVCLKLMQAL
jgi:6-phosphogluconolactonase